MLDTDDREVVAVVAFDPAYSGPCGVCIRSVVPTEPPFVTYQGSVFSPAMSRFIGDNVAELCKPGQRVVFVSESDAFGSLTVARQLGIAVGVVEGLLLDLNAIGPGQRFDVRTSVWRAAVFTKVFKARVRKATRGARRELWKRGAREAVSELYQVDLGTDAAEAVLMSDWAIATKPWEPN